MFRYSLRTGITRVQRNRIKQTAHPRCAFHLVNHLLSLSLHFIIIIIIIIKSWDSSVSIATDYGLDDRMIGVRIPAGLGIFLFDTASTPALGPTKPTIEWLPGVLSLGVKRPRREADHLHLVPRSKNVWSYTSTRPIGLHGLIIG
jgi:hypothetical protein